ncbi:4'-phosphopantetheinyl transferase superfamily protein [Streptomyces sp. NPDC001493]
MRTSGACGGRCRRRSEPHSPLREGILPAVSLPAERDHLALLSTRRPSICWERLLFSAKESVYKAWFPLTGQSLGFDEADITFRPRPRSSSPGQLPCPATRLRAAVGRPRTRSLRGAVDHP